MPDQAANIALDTKRSCQVSPPDSRGLIAEISHLLDGDLRQWLLQNPTGSSTIYPHSYNNTFPNNNAQLLRSFILS